jgi:hypothetical protein
MLEWDEKKRLRNLKEHGVDFADAALIFERPVVERIDSRSYGEVRYRALGRIESDYFIVVYTWRGEKRRLISAWRLGKDGKRRYAKLLDG